MKLINLTFLALLSLPLSGCFLADISFDKAYYADTFVDNLSNDPNAFDDFFLEKTYTIRGGGWIVVEDDFGAFRAIDIYSWIRDSYSFDLDYFDDFSKEVYWNGGNTWEDLNGNLYEEKAVAKKDLEKIAHDMEKLKVEAMGEGLSSQYGLSSERGFKVAKLITNWKKVSATRSMTDADADILSAELFGFDLNKGLDAIKKHKEGNSEDFQHLLKIAAEVNEVSPEHMNEILKDYLK